MHSTAVWYFSGHLAIRHGCEALAFVQDVARLTKADTMPPLQLQELRKLLPLMHAKSTDWLTHDSQPPLKNRRCHSPEYHAPVVMFG